MEYVFVCNYGENRSPVAAERARKIALERNLDLKTSFMALYPADSKQAEIDKERITRADKVFVMEPGMLEVLETRYKVKRKDVVCLDVPDEYNCHGLAGPKMREMLERVLEKKLDSWIS